MILMLAVVAALAEPPKLPPPYTCDDVRSYVAQYGKTAAWLWARASGYSRAEIKEAAKCLR